MTNRIPALNLDTLAIASITYYITSTPTDDMRALFADPDNTDDYLADITLDELTENELIFDLFTIADPDTAAYDALDLTFRELIRDPELHSMITDAFANARKFIESLPIIPHP